MQTSPEITKICAAIVAAKAELENVAFDAANPHFKSKYASLAGTIEATTPTLAKHGLAVIQLPTSQSSDVLTLKTMLLHTSGEYIASEYSMKPQQATPQGLGSAITYARRYALMAVLGISSFADDDDGNAATARTPQAQPTTCSAQKFGEMVAFIEQGKGNLVKSAMSKYQFTPEQSATLTSLFLKHNV